ncbi:AI-2E family transporter [Massilia horti]|uniref:AI-2E family transporter n=1 Tax=Massilia horti TaxID=2562153 RepID=A0A4Y9T0V6_9BURK|nr:AI-2E family transporter [Massilia horti]TFW31187.1 AI-2E family transporter [Massilia horti]
MKFERLVEQLTGIIALLVLVGGALMVVAPFVTALIWGAILAYCSWRPFQRLAKAIGGRPGLAALLVVLVILVVLIGPVLYAGVTVTAKLPVLVARAQEQLAAGVPPLPDWISRLPLVGPRIDQAWQGLANHNPAMVERVRELARPILHTSLEAGFGLLQGLGLLIVSVLFAAFFYLNGKSLGIALEAAMRRIAGARAPSLLALLGGTVKGVVYGILGTSLVQAILCGIGYWLAGLPSPGLLAAITFFLAFVPGGPLLVILPGAVWLVRQDAAAWAVFLIVWGGVVAIAIDNVLKPMIIGKSSHMPFILTLLGVIGGAKAFGLLGVFVGPTLLAVAYAVLSEWTADTAIARAPEPAAPVGAPMPLDPAPTERRHRSS